MFDLYKFILVLFLGAFFFALAREETTDKLSADPFRGSLCDSKISANDSTRLRNIFVRVLGHDYCHEGPEIQS